MEGHQPGRADGWADQGRAGGLETLPAMDGGRRAVYPVRSEVAEGSPLGGCAACREAEGAHGSFRGAWSG